MPCRTLSSIPSLYPLDDNSAPTPTVTTKCADIAKCPLGSKLPPDENRCPKPTCVMVIGHVNGAIRNRPALAKPARTRTGTRLGPQNHE